MSRDIVFEKLRKYFTSYWYVATVACIILIFYFTPVAYVGFAALALLLAASFIFCDDGRAYLPVILMVIYIVNYDMVYVNMNLLIILGSILIGIVLASMIYRLVMILKTKNYTIGNLGLPFIIMVVTMSTGGIIADFNILSTLAILGAGGVMFLAYFFLVNTIKENFKNYLCVICVIVGIIVLIQVIGYYITVDDFWASVDRKQISLGWGISNNIGMVFVTIIPICLYMSTEKKHGAAYLVLSFLLYLGLLMTFSRGCILFFTLLLPFMLVYTFIKSHNKIYCGAVLLLFLIVVVIGLTVFSEEIMRIFKSMLEIGLSDNGRIDLFVQSAGMFFKNPIFGRGFAVPEGSIQQIFYKAHNTFLQQLACCGIVGFLGLIPYYYVLYKQFFKKITVFKLFAFFSVLILDLYGLIDMTLVVIYVQLIIYCLTIAAEREDNGRPLFKKLSYKPLQNAC